MNNKKLFASENKRREKRGEIILYIEKDEKFNSFITNIAKEFLSIKKIWLKRKKFEKYLLHPKEEHTRGLTP